MILLNSFGDFVGSMHPLIVHLPIGFVIAAILGEILKIFKPSLSLTTPLKLLWIISSLSAIVAVICGLLLANTGHYIGDGLSIHKWTSISVAVLCSILALHYMGWAPLGKIKHPLAGLVMFLLLTSGHFGGEMTHGEAYLANHMPFWPEASATSQVVKDFENRDTVFLYEELILPILENKCMNCHNEEVMQGNFDMSSYEGLMDNTFGDNIAKGDPLKSSIIKRVLLTPDNEKFMPPSGIPLSYLEKRLLSLWIEEGAGEEINLKELSPPDDLKNLLERHYNIDFKRKSFYEVIKIDPLPEEIITIIENAQFNVDRLAADNFLIDVTRIGKSEEVTLDELETLLKAPEHVTWLDLSGTHVADEHLKTIGQLRNLTKLKLQNTQISDVGMTHLQNLKHLTSLNLYGTRVTNASVESLSALKSLTHLYLWQTKIDEEGMDAIRANISDLEIVSGIN